LLYRRLPLGLGKLAYIPKGPLVDWQDPAQVRALVAALDQTARARGAIALTVEPALPDTAAHAVALEQAGFVPSVTAIQPRRTLVVDLTPDREEILAAMKSKTRYNIRLAGRKGVKVYRGDAADVEIFNKLIQVTSSRNEFGVHSADYYRRAFKLFAPREQVALFLADYEGQPLAGVMAFALNQAAWYFYGASSNVHRNLMAPYAVQWAAMEWAKDMGCTTYDLWGVPDYDKETLEAQFTERQDGLWGVYRFKRGFGGRLTRTIGAWDRAYRPLRYRLYRWALRWR
jgi:lipid II:glycine glycyltransferase (peptidoglycan interpeptide bridge formation enzyme)